MRTVALIVLSVSLLSGCVTRPLTTPPGRAEVYLPNATPVAIKDVIVADMVAKGFSLSQDTQSSLVFVKEIANMMAAAHVRSHLPVKSDLEKQKSRPVWSGLESLLV